MAAFTSYLAFAAIAGSAVMSERARKKAEKAAKDVPPPEKPEAPIGVPTTGEGEVSQRRKSIKTGRGGTILTGELAPKSIGKRKILGGPVG